MTITEQSNDRINIRQTEAFALASALFRGFVVISEFVRSYVRPRIPDAALKTDADAVVFGQFLRIDSWLRTLCKLDEPADFQAVASACRALLETTIDVAFVTHRTEDHAKILAWEQSAKFKHAEAPAAYLARTNRSPDDEEAVAVAFASAEKAKIETLRKRFGWIRKDGSTFHPERWTKHKLADDARGADGLGLPFKFEDFYETQYRRLCWLVHGSALAIRGVPAEHFPGIAGLLFPACGDLGLFCSELVLKHLSLWTGADAEQFETVRRSRLLMEVQTRRFSLGLPLLEIPR
jgi:hypothetical protein